MASQRLTVDPCLGGDRPLSVGRLEQENLLFRGSGGVSEENRKRGFKPAFLDQTTGVVYLSCFADGSPAPLHLLDGLPDLVATEQDRQGRTLAVRSGVIAGFIRDGLFYTRAQAAEELCS